MSRYRKAFGYAGYYNGLYLRSSYEYAYTKYLEATGTTFVYEENTYTLTNGTHYKPDFSIYVDGKLSRIVEVKGSIDLISQEIAKPRMLSTMLNVEYEVITLKDLVRLCRSVSLSAYHLIGEWKAMFKDQEYNMHSMSMSNSNNPMYGVKQSETSKRANGNKTIARMSNKEWKDFWYSRVLATNTSEEFKQKLRAASKGKHPEQVTKVCKFCKKEFSVSWEERKHQYCSVRCAGKHALQIATAAKQEQRNKALEQLKESIVERFATNSIMFEELSKVPLNKISTHILPLIADILASYNVTDWRTIAKAFGCTGRKEMIIKLISLVKVQRPSKAV